MKRKFSICLLCLGLAIGLYGCAKDTEKENSTEVVSPTAAITQAVFAPVKEKVEEKTEGISGLAETLEFCDASEQAKYNAMNRMMSNYSPSWSSNFCIDEATGAVYFVNWGKDYYLYRLIDGKAELAVSLPISMVATANGHVYFMIDSHGKYEMEAYSDGDIYYYTPSDGSVELLYAAGEAEEAEEYCLAVDDNGVYFSYMQKVPAPEYGEGVTIGKMTYGFLPYGETKLQQDTLEMTMPGWNNYKFSYLFTSDDYSVPPELILVDRQDNQNRKELSIGRPYLYCVVDDCLYYMSAKDSMNFHNLNLVTGEDKAYDLKEAYMATGFYETTEMFEQHLKENPNTQFFHSFTYAGGYIWLTNSAFLYRIDMETGVVDHFSLQKDRTPFIGTLYTDGDNLYALYSENWDGGKCLVKIGTEIIGVSDMGHPLLEMEYITE